MNDLLRNTIIKMGSIFIVATINGTILCVLYPYIHYLFPTAAEQGIIATHVAWWPMVAISWILGILFNKGFNITNEVHNTTVMSDSMFKMGKGKENEEV